MRPWHDFHVASHLAFLPALHACLTSAFPFLELAVFLAPVCVFSVAYHRLQEPRGSLVARLDAFFAHVLFAYGVAHMFYAPAPWLQAVYAVLFSVVCATHVGGILVPSVWDRTHSVGMHLVPGLWCWLVVRFSRPLFFGWREAWLL